MTLRLRPLFHQRARCAPVWGVWVAVPFIALALLGCGSEGTSANLRRQNPGYVPPEAPRECILPDGRAPVPTPPPAAVPLQDTGAPVAACGGGVAEAGDLVVD